jgi:hypothetical protein
MVEDFASPTSSTASSPRLFQVLGAAALTPSPVSPASSAASSPMLYVLEGVALTPSPVSPASSVGLSLSAHAERVAEMEAGREWRARKLGAATPRRWRNVDAPLGTLAFQTPPRTPPHRRRTSTMTPRARRQLHDSEKIRERRHAEEYDNTPEMWNKRARLQ